MAPENASSESLKQLVEQIDAQPPVVLLPEFQRDFVWEMEQTYALFDSLIRGIFVGSVIYGKPSFEMTLRRMDHRPRKGAGSRAKVERLSYTEEKIKHDSQVYGLKIVLDGQQRTTSIYRALKGIDRVYFVVRPSVTAAQVKEDDLEALMHPDHGVQGEDVENAVCIPLHYAFRYMSEAPFDDEVREYFDNETRLGRRLAQAGDDAEAREAFKVFRQMLPKFKTMFEQPQLLSYYLLDMGLDKFTTFFERSNSRGIQLNFTDILAAKVFGNFNLRQAFEDFGEKHPGMPVNRELLVRATALMSGQFADKIEKARILKDLRADHFKAHWEDVTRLYDRALAFLVEQRFVVAVKWMPYDNMLIPLMMFFAEMERQGQGSLTQKQLLFLRWWFWASVFSERYTAASNEKIMADSGILRRVARGEMLEGSYFLRFRPSVGDAEELMSYSRSQSAIYRGVLNLVHFEAGGLRDWTNDGLISTGPLGVKELQDHHFFPKGFLKKTESVQDRPDEVDAIKDCVLNRVLMPKNTNLRASDKKPHSYLQELLKLNPSLKGSLTSHLVPVSLLEDESQSLRVYATLLERGGYVVELIRRETVDAEQQVRAAFVSEAPVRVQA
ncbi:DUF262 domain-containing protein [Deinococcus sp. SDU3-2]|uniref:DUF262 domain-containing protein n=1 Tax=Deinococcus terrestris TaxID=2651870 RepID=A0A7X1NWM5_9DEIO|nr:DUF262 domain-containing protein [Deinococcus terrestris]MPY67186.1 DUF262 domain-containing protein [Deinococcus terrestris]